VLIHLILRTAYGLTLLIFKSIDEDLNTPLSMTFYYILSYIYILDLDLFLYIFKC